MISVPPEADYPIDFFERGLLDVSIFSTTGDRVFQTYCFADFEQFKSKLFNYFTNFGQVKVTLLSLSNMLGCKKQSKASLFDKKLKNHT